MADCARRRAGWDARPWSHAARSHACSGAPVLVVWDLDNVRLRGPEADARALVQMVQEVARAFSCSPPGAHVHDGDAPAVYEIRAYANQRTASEKWYRERGAALLQV